jgi:dTDP-4-dehydrorhamnose reductase
MAGPRVLVVGSQGRLGLALMNSWKGLGLKVDGVWRNVLDLNRPQSIAAALSTQHFDLLINTAGLVNVDACEKDAAELQRVNVDAPEAMAKVCAGRRARMIQISTDYVFSGRNSGLLDESEPTDPCNAYGRSKLAAEQAVQSALPDALLARVSWLFGGHKESVPERILSQARTQSEVRSVDDKWASPTYVDDLCHWLHAWAVEQSEWQGGPLHLCNTGHASWAEYAQGVLDIAKDLGLPLRTYRITGHTMVGFSPFIAERPVHTILSTGRFRSTTSVTPRPWQEALREHLVRTQLPR